MTWRAGDRARPRQPQERRVPASRAPGRRQGLRRVAPLPGGRGRKRTCGGGRVVLGQHPRGARGHRPRPIRRAARRRRDDARAEHRRQARTGLVSARAPVGSASTPSEAAVFEDALSGVEAGRAGHFGLVVGVDRVGQADALQAHGADVVVQRSRRPAGRPMINEATFPVEPWHVRETTLDLDLLAQSESVFALSNGHIGLARQPRRGRTARLAGHLPQLVLRDASAALRRGGLRLSRRRPDDRRRHQRQDPAAAGRRRAVRRPLRRTAAPRTRARLPCGHADPRGALALPRGPHDRTSPRRGWCRWPNAAWPPSSTSSRPSTNSPASQCNPSWWPTRISRRRRTTRARRRLLQHTSARRSPTNATANERGADPPHPRQRADDGRGDGPRRRGARPRRGRHRMRATIWRARR